MATRIYELARDMGIKGQALADKINAMSLGFTVNNHMTAISDQQEEMIRRAL
ncbi:MAG: translation initiation factor IF-2 N-terminal domain-containing protein, partial [Myxococcales bacterium]|nr:translation initiation factor IF-2 N-terminal domain-containing protein [Myxococcales bacterium]